MDKKKIILSFMTAAIFLRIAFTSALAETTVPQIITNTIYGDTYYTVSFISSDNTETQLVANGNSAKPQDASLWNIDDYVKITKDTEVHSIQKELSLEDMLNPNRSIEVHASWEGDILYFGDEATLMAILNGYDNAVYTLQWQRSIDGVTWTDIPGETGTTITVIVTEDNYLNYWRVAVTITDVIE